MATDISANGPASNGWRMPLVVAFAPTAALFVAFMAIPLAAMFWRAANSSELATPCASARSRARWRS